MHFDLKAIVQLILPHLSLTFCSFILVCFLYLIISFYLKARKIHGGIKSGIDVLPKTEFRKNFKNSFHEKIDISLKENSVFGHNWREYRETLIDPDPTNPNSNFKNSIQPYKFFSFDEVIRSEINVRFFHSVPGKLTGLGVLGTFLGLTFGIQSIGGTQGNSEQLMAGIDNLLKGAGAAFMTSIVGIITSILFSILEKKIFSKIENDFYQFLAILEKCLEYQTMERIAEESLREVKKQTQYLSNFSQDLSSALMEYVDTVVNRVGTQVIAPSFTNLIEEIRSLKEIQANASEELLKDLADKMTGGLSKSANDQFKGIEGALTTFQTTIPQLVLSMEEAQKSITENNKALAKNFKESLSENGNELTIQVGELTKQMSTTVNQIISGLSDQFSQQAREFNQELTKSISSIERNLESLTSRVSDKERETTSSLNDVISNLKTAFSGFDDKVQNFKQTVGETQKSNEVVANILNQYQAITDTHQRVTTNLEGCVTNFLGLRSYFSENTTSLTSLATELQKYSSNLNSSQLEIQRVWDNYKARFEDIDESTKKMFENIDHGLNAYQVKVNEFQEKLFDNVENISKTFAGAVSELSEAIESLEDKTIA